MDSICNKVNLKILNNRYGNVYVIQLESYEDGCITDIDTGEYWKEISKELFDVLKGEEE